MTSAKRKRAMSDASSELSSAPSSPDRPKRNLAKDPSEATPKPSKPAAKGNTKKSINTAPPSSVKSTPQTTPRKANTKKNATPSTPRRVSLPVVASNNKSPSKVKAKKAKPEDPIDIFLRTASARSEEIKKDERKRKREEARERREEEAHLASLARITPSCVPDPTRMTPSCSPLLPPMSPAGVSPRDAPPLETHPSPSNMVRLTTPELLLSESEDELKGLSFRERLQLPLKEPDVAPSSPLSSPPDDSPTPEAERPAARPLAELPPGIKLDDTCIVQQNRNWFVGKLLGFHPTAERPYEIQDVTGLVRKVRRKQVLFLHYPPDARKFPDCTFGKFVIAKPSARGVRATTRDGHTAPNDDDGTRPFSDLSLTAQVKRLHPHLLRLINEQYAPAQWRIDKFYDGRQSVRTVHYGDLTADEDGKKEFSNALQEWARNLVASRVESTEDAAETTTVAETAAEAVDHGSGSNVNESSSGSDSSNLLATPKHDQTALPPGTSKPPIELNDPTPFGTPPPLDTALGLIPTSPGTPSESPSPVRAQNTTRFWDLNDRQRNAFVSDVLLLEAIIARAMYLNPTDGTDEEQYRAAMKLLTRQQKQQSKDDWGPRTIAVEERLKKETARREREAALKFALSADKPEQTTMTTLSGRIVKKVSYVSPPRKARK